MVYSYALLAENADVGLDGRFYVFKGGIEVLFCPSVPCMVSTLALLVRIGIPPTERGFPHTLQIQGYRPTGEAFTPALVSRMEPKIDSAPPDRTVSHVFVVNFNGVMIQELGLHLFSIIGDGQKLGEFTFYADQIPDL